MGGISIFTSSVNDVCFITSNMAFFCCFDEPSMQCLLREENVPKAVFAIISKIWRHFLKDDMTNFGFNSTLKYIKTTVAGRLKDKHVNKPTNKTMKIKE